VYLKAGTIKTPINNPDVKPDLGVLIPKHMARLLINLRSTGGEGGI
jgi:hypothetical protein